MRGRGQPASMHGRPHWPRGGGGSGGGGGGGDKRRGKWVGVRGDVITAACWLGRGGMYRVDRPRLRRHGADTDTRSIHPVSPSALFPHLSGLTTATSRLGISGRERSSSRERYQQYRPRSHENQRDGGGGGGGGGFSSSASSSPSFLNPHAARRYPASCVCLCCSIHDCWTVNGDMMCCVPA